jgi:hypothetical protein
MRTATEFFSTSKNTGGWILLFLRSDMYLENPVAFGGETVQFLLQARK